MHLESPGCSQLTYFQNMVSQHTLHWTGDLSSCPTSSNLWENSCRCACTLLQVTTQGNGQMEQANQVLEQYLQVYTNYQQDDWSELLPLVELAYNNATNATMGVSVSPFFTNKGYHPEITADLQAVTTSTEAKQYV